jgi:hypothetical protein
MEILEMEVAGTRRRKIADSKAVKRTHTGYETSRKPVILRVVRRGEFKLAEFSAAGTGIE